MDRFLCLSLAVAVGCSQPPPPPTPMPEDICSSHQLTQSECAEKVKAFLAPVDPLDGRMLEWRFEPGSLFRSGWRPMDVVETVTEPSRQLTVAEVTALKPKLQVVVGDTVGLAAVTGHGQETTFAVPADHADAPLLHDVLGGFLARAVPLNAGRLHLQVERRADQTLEVVSVRTVVWFWASSESEITRSDAQAIAPEVKAGDELRGRVEDHPRPEKVVDLMKHWLARHAPSDVKRIPSSLADLQALRASEAGEGVP